VGSFAYRHARQAINAALALLLAVPLFARGAEAVTIVAFGDSLTAGYGIADASQHFHARLEQSLRVAGVDAKVVNAGVSGDTTSAGLARLDWSIPDGVDLVILELGANDALRGVQPGVTQANLDAMLAKLAARNIPVLLAGMLAPPNLGSQYGTLFNTIYPRLSEKFAVPLYPFFLDGVAAQQPLLQNDGMHPKPEGVDVIVRNITPYVLWALKVGPMPPGA
jgi:acyl-CoA thioesterase-1